MSDDAATVAKRLLAQRLVRVLGDGSRLAGTIVEVEAYLGEADRASHTFNNHRSPRNESMYLPGGHAYVYFTYGMHYCLNVVCGRRDEGTAVLIRAIEPTEGIPRMHEHRPAACSIRDLCSGPGRLTQALAIDRSFDGVSLLSSSDLFIEQTRRRRLSDSLIAATPRIGLNPAPHLAGEWAVRPLRFVVVNSVFASRPAPVAAGGGGSR